MQFNYDTHGFDRAPRSSVVRCAVSIERREASILSRAVSIVSRAVRGIWTKSPADTEYMVEWNRAAAPLPAVITCSNFSRQAGGFLYLLPPRGVK